MSAPSFMECLRVCAAPLWLVRSYPQDLESDLVR